MNAAPWPGMRIGDAEREAAVTALGEHYASGRLTREEYDERADRALKARTPAEVAPLFTDLPAPHPYAQAAAPRMARPAPGRSSSWPVPGAPVRGRTRLPLLPLLLIAIGLAVLLKAPFLVFIVLGVLWFARSHRRGC